MRERQLRQGVSVAATCLLTTLGCAGIDEVLLEALSTEPAGETEVTPEPEPPPGPFDDAQGLGPDTNLIYNGHFEHGLNGWRAIQEPNSVSGDSAHGSQSAKVELDGEISQTVTVVPNSDYRLTLMVQITAESPEELAEATGSGTVFIGDEAVDVPFPGEAGAFLPAEVSFNSGTADRVTVAFNGGFIRVDDVLLEGPLPETFVDAGGYWDWELWELDACEHPLQRAEADGSGERKVEWFFDAVHEFVTTPTEVGARCELKIATNLRHPAGDLYEVFRASITPQLSVGAETLVARWNLINLPILAAVHVSDISTDVHPDLELLNGIPGDGIFDIYGSVLVDGQNEERVALGVVDNGETFDLEAINDHGVIHFTTLSRGERRSMVSTGFSTPAATYLKFGSYLQEIDPNDLSLLYTETELIGIPAAEKIAAFREFYETYDITSGLVVFHDVFHGRVVDSQGPL